MSVFFFICNLGTRFDEKRVFFLFLRIFVIIFEKTNNIRRGQLHTKSDQAMPANKLVTWLPIKPHLKLFLETKENLKEQPLDITSDTPVASYLSSLLTLKSAIREDSRDVINPDLYTEKLYFQVSGSDTHRMRIFICPTRVIRFNGYVQKMMYYTLFEVVDWFTAEGMKEKEAIYMFINRYRLYDVNFDALKKACTRRRTKLNLPVLNQRKSNFFFNSVDGDADISVFGGAQITPPESIAISPQRQACGQLSMF